MLWPFACPVLELYLRMIRYVLAVWGQEWKIETSVVHANDCLEVSLSSMIKLKEGIVSLTVHKNV